MMNIATNVSKLKAATNSSIKVEGPWCPISLRLAQAYMSAATPAAARTNSIVWGIIVANPDTTQAFLTPGGNLAVSNG